MVLNYNRKNTFLHQMLLWLNIYAQTKTTVLISHFFISRKNRKARKGFGKLHLHWSVEERRNIPFSDESKFKLKVSESKHKCVRSPNRRLDPKYFKETHKHGGRNAMVNGCFSWCLGTLYETSEIMDHYLYKNILKTVRLPFAKDEMFTV